MFKKKLKKHGVIFPPFTLNDRTEIIPSVFVNIAKIKYHIVSLNIIKLTFSKNIFHDSYKNKTTVANVKLQKTDKKQSVAPQI